MTETNMWKLTCILSKRSLCAAQHTADIPTRDFLDSFDNLMSKQGLVDLFAPALRESIGVLLLT